MNYTAGDLDTIMFVKESTYGITPTSGWAYGTEVTKIVRKEDLGQYVNWWPDSRSPNHDAMVAQKKDAGFTLIGNERTRVDFLNPLIEGALGSAEGTTEDALPSYSIIIGVGDTRWLYSGCKVDSLEIYFGDAKAVLEFSANIMARDCTKMSGSTVNGSQYLTVEIPQTKSTDPGAQLGTVMVGTEQIYPIDGKLIISNSLVRERGEVIRNTVHYPCTVSIGEGRREITLEFNIFLKDMQYLDYMLSNAEIASSSVVLGEYTLTFERCRFVVDGQGWPEFMQDTMRQKLRMRAHQVSIA